MCDNLIYIDVNNQMVCSRENVFASVCAIARAYPTFTLKTSANFNTKYAVSVEVLVTGDETITDTDAEVWYSGSTLVDYTS